MKPRITQLLPAALAFCLLLPEGRLKAGDEDIKLTASVEPAEVQPGAIADYTISVEGDQPDEIPPPRLPQGLTVLTPRPSFRLETGVVNGVSHGIWTFSWRISAQQKGEFVIPPQELHVRGKLFRTNETRLVVKDNPEHNASQFDPLLTTEVEKREVYVGEVTPITVNLYVHRRTQLRRVGLIEISKDNFAIQRFPQQAEETSVLVGGAPYRGLAYHSTMSALKPGKFKLGPASCDIILDVQTATGGPGQPFFPQFDTRDVKVQGNEIEITVLPLPEKGRPAKFSGAVGDFQLSVSADPVELLVGDPTSVEFRFSGRGNFDSLSTPPLAGNPEDWRTYPARRLNLGPPDPAGESVSQNATFSQVFIPKCVVTELPPFEFSYFSPTKKDYVTMRTPPVPLRVKAAEIRPEAGPSTAATAGGVEPESIPSPNVRPSDILTMMPEGSAWLVARTPPWKDRTFVMANAAALGALLVMLAGKGAVILLQSRAAAPSAPVRRLWRALRGSKMDRGDFYAAAARYVWMHPGSEKELAGVVAKHHQLNFSSATAEARAPLPSSERSDVLAQLRSHCVRPS